MRAILFAIAWTLAASAAHPGDQYSEGNQRHGEEPDALAPAVLASEAISRSNKSPEGDHVLTSLEVLQLSGLLNDPVPRAQRGDIEVVEEPKPDDRGDVPGSILYGHVPGRSRRDIGSSRKLLWANTKERDTWGFAEDDGLLNDQPSSDEDNQQQHIKRPMNHHHNHHRQEEYRKAQEELRRPQQAFRHPSDQYRSPQDQFGRPQEDRVAQEEQSRKLWEEQQRRRQEEERRKAQEEQQRKTQDEERRRQYEQQRRAPENQSRDPNSRKTETPASTTVTYEERLREWQRMKEEHDRLIRERENASKNPNHRENQRKTEEELENERKLQDYIRRNTPINLTRSNRPENLTRPSRPDYPYKPGQRDYPNRAGQPDYPNRPGQPAYPNRPGGQTYYSNRTGQTDYPNRPGQSDNVSKSGRPENLTRPVEDPHKESRIRHREQYDQEMRRRQQEQQRRIENERQLRERARTRSPPVNNQQQENEQVRMAEFQRREEDEQRRREKVQQQQQQGRNFEDPRNRPNIYTGHHIPSTVDERRRPEDPMLHLKPTPNPDEHQRTIRPDDPASQYPESPDQNWSAGRRYPVRPDNRNQRLNEDARQQEREKCRRLLEEDDQRRKEEETRRRQPWRPDQPNNPEQTRPEDDNRYYEHRRNEANVPRPSTSYNNETEEQRLRRLKDQPVGATIVVRADGSKYTVDKPAAITLRQGFGEEIAFTGFSPSKSGAVAESFPSPVTEHAPAASPPPCVWALVVCCRNPRNELRLRRCFEATNCLSWDSNKCGIDNVRSANKELMNFYISEQTRTNRPLVYEFDS